MRELRRAAVIMIVILGVLVVAFASCVLDLTWAPVHDAPNFYAPTATPTSSAPPSTSDFSVR